LIIISVPDGFWLAHKVAAPGAGWRWVLMSTVACVRFGPFELEVMSARFCVAEWTEVAAQIRTVVTLARRAVSAALAVLAGGRLAFVSVRLSSQSEDTDGHQSPGWAW